MAYSRFIDSDVYIFADVSGGYTCCACMLKHKERFWTTDDIITHVKAHMAAGHDVPADVIPCIEMDRAENDAFSGKVRAGMCAACDGTGDCQPLRPHPKTGPCEFCKDTRKCERCGGTGGTDAWVESQKTQ
jgi:hypothetical protein